MLPGTSQLGRRGRVNTYETTGNNSPVLSNKVEQDFKGINDESDLETEGSERGLDKPAFSLGQGGGAPPKKGTGHLWGWCLPLCSQ